VSPDAGIDHLGGGPLSGKGSLQPRHEAFAQRQTEPRRERIAERDDLDRFGRRLGRHRRDGHSEKERNATNSRMHDVAQRFATPI